MSLHLLSRLQHRALKEEELQQAEAQLRKGAVPLQFGNHPARSELERFAAGQYPPGHTRVNAIFEHLHDCDACLALMSEIRGRSPREERRTKLLRNRLIFSVLVVLVLAAISFWVVRAPRPSTVATVDLRQVMRGQEGSSIIVNRESPTIRVLLPVGSAGGNYDVGIFDSAKSATPLLLSSAQSRVENGDEIITLSIPTNKLKPGFYLFGIRREGSVWSRYAIQIK